MEKSDLELNRPSAALKKSYLDSLLEIQASGENARITIEDAEGNFDEFVKAEIAKERMRTADRVPETVFWAACEGVYVGRISIRHELNDFLRWRGGHIGYDVRPSKRRKGFGAKMLALALKECPRLGIAKVMITCDENNIGSRKIIEGNGGALEAKDFDNGIPFLRYWVEIR